MTTHTKPASERSVRVRRAEHPARGGLTTSVVFCQHRERFVSLSEYNACDQCDGLSLDLSERGSLLRCAPRGERIVEPVRREPQPGPELACTPISELMTTPVQCVTPDTSLESVASVLLNKGISALPVIDNDGTPVGIVSKTDLLRQRYNDGETLESVPVRLTTEDGFEVDLGSGFHAARLATRTVADAMTPFVLSLPQDAPVGVASALMSYEGVHRVAVTGRDGSVSGILSSLDVLHWYARTSGYEVPRLGPTHRA